MVKTAKLSAGHARALITTKNASQLANQIVSRGLSVRETEELVRKSSGEPAKKRESRRDDGKDADTRALEADLAANLKMGVRIDHGAAGEGGKITITYRTLDDLDLLCRVLSVIPRGGSV